MERGRLPIRSSSLKISFVVDTLRTQTDAIIQNFMTLSHGLRRGENAGDMNRKKDVYTRVMSEGAFSTVDTPGIHAQQQLLLAFQRRAELLIWHFEVACILLMD